MKKEVLIPSLSIGLTALIEFAAASSVTNLVNITVFDTFGIGCLYLSEKMLEKDSNYYVKTCNVSDCVNRYIPIH